MRKHNFYPGPAILPDSTIENTIEALKDLEGSGVSLACTSHRSKEFVAIMKDAQTLMKQLLTIPEGYSVIYMGGGASLQFAMIPFNLMNKKATYINTGSWSQKALKEAKVFGEVEDIKAEDYFSLPKNIKVSDDSDYVHITSNNTIFGTQIHKDYDFGTIPVAADMSSDILSRPLDVSKYGVIYGGAQKNVGPSGVAFAIVREDILGKVSRPIPSLLNYKTHIDKDSMFNTPPVVNVYMLLQTLKWVEQKGGVEVMQKINKEKAELLYNEIDSNPLFVPTIKNAEDRSVMNVCWVMNEKYKEFEKEFIDFAAQNYNIIGIKGHRSVGGFRASIYNACKKESVETLVDAMKKFAELKA